MAKKDNTAEERRTIAFEQIAILANTARQMAVNLVCNTQSPGTEHALEVLVERIGLIADAHCNYGVCGQESWIYPPGYPKCSKAEGEAA